MRQNKKNIRWIIENAVKREISNLVIEQRKKNGWTREELSTICSDLGLSIAEGTIKSYEYETRIPPLYKLFYLYYVFDIQDTEHLCNIFSSILEDMNK